MFPTTWIERPVAATKEARPGALRRGRGEGARTRNGVNHGRAYDATASLTSFVDGLPCIAHDINPRAYLHRVVSCIVHGWPQAKLRELLPDRMLAAHPDLFIGDPDALPLPSPTRDLAR